MDTKKVIAPSLLALGLAGSFTVGQKLAAPTRELHPISVRFTGDSSRVAFREKGEREKDLIVDARGNVHLGATVITIAQAALLAKDVASCRTSIEKDVAGLASSIPLEAK